MEKYKLCKVDYYQSASVMPMDENGHITGSELRSDESDDNYYYAIYENVDGEWEEWGYYDQDFEEARNVYQKLMKGDK